MLLAQIAASSSATWSPSLFYQALEPYLISIAVAVFMSLLGWIAAICQKHTGIVLTQRDRDAVQMAATNAAGRIFAAGEAKVATMSVQVDSPLIQAEIPVVTAAVKSSIDSLGLTPERVGALIQGKLGAMQAEAQASAPPVVVVPTGGK